MISDLTMNADHSRRMTRSLRIVQRYVNGEKVQKIADDFGCSNGTVLRLARAAGCPKRDRGNEERKAAILSDYKIMPHIPIATIADDHGVSVALVSKLASEVGIQRRTFKKRKNKP